MMRSYIRAALIFSFLSLGLFAQEPTEPVGMPNDLDQQYVPGKNSILNSANTNLNAASRSYESSPVKNVIKFNALLLARSTASVFWEHKISSAFSVEGGLGVCYGVDYMQKMFAEMGDAFGGNSNYNKVKLNTLLQNSTYSGSPGPFLSLGAKFYFSYDAPDGPYFSFNLRYAKYNMMYNTDPNNGAVIIGDPNFDVKNFGFNIIYGYQIVSNSGGKASFVQDLFMGFGVKKTSYTGFYYPSNGSNNQPGYVNSGTDISQVQPAVILGYTLGFGF